jgi:hypothetical protein
VLVYSTFRKSECITDSNIALIQEYIALVEVYNWLVMVYDQIVIGLYALGPELISQGAFTVYVLGAGVAVSTITYIFQRRELKLKGLAEIFRELSLLSHRAARKVLYEGVTLDSYAVLGLDKERTSPDVVKNICENIIRSDLSIAATLIRHGLLDGPIFIEEYWWIILRAWDKME